MTVPQPAGSLDFPGAVPTLIGEGLHLRGLSEHDIPGWFARATDAESADLAGDPIPASMSEGAAWLQRHLDRFREKSAIRWAIVPTGSTQSVGTVGLDFASTDRRTAALGIVVARGYWARGIGTTAARLATGYAFSALGIAEVRAEALQRNLPSLRLLEKVGFRRLPAVAAAAQPDDDACFVYVLTRAGQRVA